MTATTIEAARAVIRSAGERVAPPAPVVKRLADLIRVKRLGNQHSVTIDGAEFPWFIAERGVQVAPPSSAECPSVTMTVLAERVELVDALDAP